jgi:phospholipid/cholesterol/gamma-HCH transport system substrate-binding protein
LALPGTQGNGSGAYTIQAQLPDVSNIQPNSRVRVGDVTVGNVTKIELQGWHALLTMRINGDVNLPENATAKVGQTSILGSLHVELAAPTNEPPTGHLHDGSVIPLRNGGAYPTTEQTLSVASMLLNGGGLGRVQDITKTLSVAFTGREGDAASLVRQLDQYTNQLDTQKHDIVAAIESLNNLAAQFADHNPVVDHALDTIPDALALLNEQRDNLTSALTKLGDLSKIAASSADQTKDALTAEFNALAPVLDSLANAGPALTRSLSVLSTFPWPKENITKWFRGDSANMTMIIDLTLSRLDTSFLTGTRFEGSLTNLELQWGRTIGQLPSPATAGNPLVAPYHGDQGP